MAKPREFPIKESAQELKSLRKKQSSYRFEKRLIWLESILTKRFKTRKQLAEYLNISPRTQERWTLQYIRSGIEGLLSDEPKNLKSRIITQEIHNGLEQRVNSDTEPFLGYWDAQAWVFQEYGVDVKYHLLRHYLIQHFKTKLKSPRKSHYKKDEEAEKAFLKTP
ncbi:transposase [Salegentibacter mishustinae]|uniref:transposase n=1 Tax=Salegentibacter mishustinae TaxID=270918 RepID=UPI001CE1495E|nr:transposase [Salegentibacter mishustinae]UBZ05588.1 transposase [Salegentibacter mishustinae]